MTRPYITYPYLATGGTAARTSPDRFADEFNVKDYGAIGDGVADDTVAFQAVLDQIGFVGGQMIIPAGKFRLTAPLTFDYAGIGLSTPRGLSIQGAGAGVSLLQVAHAGAGFYFFCTTGLAQAYGKVAGFTLYHVGSPPRQGIGILADNIAYWTLDDLIFYNLEYGIKTTDTLSVQLNRCYVRYNKYGFLLDRYIDASPPNSLTINDCIFSENYEWGLHVNAGRLLRLRGGSIEANGINGAETDRYGVKLTNPRGPQAIDMDGVYFTNNKGHADLWIVKETTDRCTFHIHGCLFARISDVNHVTHHILVARGASSGAHRVVLTGNSFNKFNTYVENPAETYVGQTGAGTTTFNDNGNDFENPALKGFT